jgi:hypothetical protein
MNPVPDTTIARRGYLVGFAHALRSQALPLAEASGNPEAGAFVKELLTDAERIGREYEELLAQHLTKRAQLKRLAAAPPTPAKH